jgi:hypothetical protein
MNVELAAATGRQQQARALLDNLHAAQFGAMPEPLLAMARNSVLGRRMLARTVSRRVPGLFAPDQERWQSWETSEGWLQWPQARLASFTRTLGAMALGPALRMIVERGTVLFVREVLGQDQWRQAQLAAPWKGSPPETIRLMGATVLRRCGTDAEALTTAVFERGQIEFIGHAERRQPELAARLSLGYAQAPATPCNKETWLPFNAVADLLAAEAATDALLMQAKFTPPEEDPQP